MTAPIISDTDTLIVDGKAIHKLLITKLRFHGDVLLTMPLIQYLKRRYPALEIDVLVYDDSANLITHQETITTIHCVGRRWKNLNVVQRIRHELSLINQLAKRQFDGFIHLTEDWRGAVLQTRLNIPVAVAGRYQRRKDSYWWNRCFSHYYAAQPSNRHIVDKQADALRALGIQVSAEELTLELQSSERDAATIRQRLLDASMHTQAFIHIHPGSRFSHKVWPAERLAELCDRFAQRGWPVVLTGAPDQSEKQFIEEIIHAAQYPPIQWGGELSLTELAELTRRAALFVGVDSAPAHIAAAVGTPSVVLFGPTSSDTWRPWSEYSTIVTANLACQPCSKKGCNNSGVSECLKTLPTEYVWRAVQKTLYPHERDPQFISAQSL